MGCNSPPGVRAPGTCPADRTAKDSPASLNESDVAHQVVHSLSVSTRYEAASGFDSRAGREKEKHE